MSLCEWIGLAFAGGAGKRQQQGLLRVAGWGGGRWVGRRGRPGAGGRPGIVAGSA